MLDRTVAPPFVKSTAFQLPQVSKSTLPNGIKLFHLGGINQELVKIEVIFRSGKWYESKPEVAQFTIQMLDKGTEKMSSSQIAEFFDQYGAHIELSSNPDYASISLYSLSKFVSILFPVFNELITQASFREIELNQMKDQFIQGLRVKNEKTSYLASKLIKAKIFGPLHPYGNTAEVQDIENIHVGDLTSYYLNKVKPSHVFILGQINKDDLTTLHDTFSKIAINKNLEPSVNIVPAKNSQEYIERKNSVQTSIRLGKRTIQRSHTDYAHLVILNYYLGGFFGSRLMKNLREKKGLTYGISSSLNSFKNDSILLIGTDVNKENRKVAVDEIMNEITLLRSSINEPELDLAKRHFIGSLQGEMASPFSILGKIKNIELNQLPDDYYQSLIEKIDSASPKTLLNLAEIYLADDSFFEVTVG